MKILKSLILCTLLAFPLSTFGQSFDQKLILGKWDIVNSDPKESKQVWKFETDTLVMITYSNSTEQQGTNTTVSNNNTMTSKEAYKFDGQVVKMKMFGMAATFTIKELTTTRLSGIIKIGDNFTKELLFNKSKE
jgi:hypothetical protein